MGFRTQKKTYMKSSEWDLILLEQEPKLANGKVHPTHADDLDNVRGGNKGDEQEKIRKILNKG